MFTSGVPSIDVNECTEDTAVCDDDTYCLNTPGSYSCKGMYYMYMFCLLLLLCFVDCDFSCESSCTGPGNTACDACADGYFQSEDGACLGKDR